MRLINSYNHHWCRAGLDDVTPADVYYGQREVIRARQQERQARTAARV